MQLITRSKPQATAHCSTRSMVGELGLSAARVSRHWRAHGLKPHRVRSFKVSRDPKPIEKLEDTVGLHLSALEHALVLCRGEKSRVQALDWMQSGLPMKKVHAAIKTHEHKRNGTTTLFAAINVLEG